MNISKQSIIVIHDLKDFLNAIGIVFSKFSLSGHQTRGPQRNKHYVYKIQKIPRDRCLVDPKLVCHVLVWNVEAEFDECHHKLEELEQS